MGIFQSSPYISPIQDIVRNLHNHLSTNKFNEVDEIKDILIKYIFKLHQDKCKNSGTTDNDWVEELTNNILLLAEDNSSLRDELKPILCNIHKIRTFLELLPAGYLYTIIGYYYIDLHDESLYGIE